MMPGAIHDRFQRNLRVLRVGAARAGLARLAPIAIAVDQPRVRAWTMMAAHRARLAVVVPVDHPALLDAVADGCSAVILGATFGGATPDRLLGFVRGAGCLVPAVVIAADPPDAVLAHAAALAPVEFLIAPRVAPDGEPPGTRWLERCIELALGGAR